MKKKLYLTVLTIFMSVGIGVAQAQNTECLTNLSIAAEHYKVKNYDAAFEPWQKVYETCPSENKAVFTMGERILKFKIKNSTGADKDGFIQDLLEVYDSGNKYFPQKFTTADVVSDKAILLSDQKMASDQELYDLIKPVFDSDLKGIKNPKVLYIYFSGLVNLHGDGKKELQEVFDVYDGVVSQNEVINKSYTDKITALLAKEEAGTITKKEEKRLKIYTRNSELLGKVAASIDAKLGGLADCTNLIPLYQKNFASKQSDVKWVKSAVGRMYSKDCTDDPMFVKLVEKQVELDPSADAYFYLATLQEKQGKSKEALANYNKAVELETDNRRKSDILYKIAVSNKKKGRKGQARKYANDAIKYNPSQGKAYLLIANLYASSANACGADAFSKRAIYWKAADMARKAGRVDPSISGRANKTAASYNAKAPTKEMIFNAAMAGKTVTFNCWVGGSIKVPNL